MKRSNGLASGTLMVLVGVFLVLRTVRRPAGGRNLVDLILGDGGKVDAAANAAAAGKATNLLTPPSLTTRPQTAGTPVKTTAAQRLAKQQQLDRGHA